MQVILEHIQVVFGHTHGVLESIKVVVEHVKVVVKHAKVDAQAYSHGVETEMRSGSEEGSYLRLTGYCITEQ